MPTDPVTPPELARELGIDAKTLRQWLRDTFTRTAHEKNARWHLTPEQVRAARGRFASRGDSRSTPSVARSRRPGGQSPGRAGSDEAYVIDLCDELLGERASRQHRFPWLLGDPGHNGRAVRLPVDAFYERAGIVVEYRERQHLESVPFFDKPHRMTVSGVHRGEQRRLYDHRRETEIPRHGLRLVVIHADDLACDGRGRLHRAVERDRAVLQAKLRA